MVAPHEMHVFRACLLEGEQGKDAFGATRTTVDKVAVEEIWALCAWETLVLEDLHQVCKLAMQIANDAELGAFWYHILDDIGHGCLQYDLALEKLGNELQREQPLAAKC